MVNVVVSRVRSLPTLGVPAMKAIAEGLPASGF
jgi:hypothetical protein